MRGFAKTRTKALLTRRTFAARQTRRTFATWMALFALALQTFMPLGQALAVDVLQDDDFQFICTMNGIQQIPNSQEDIPVPPINSGPCSHCLMHGSVALFTPEITDAIVLSIPVEHGVAFALPKQQTHASIWRGLPRPSRAPPKFV